MVQNNKVESGSGGGLYIYENCANITVNSSKIVQNSIKKEFGAGIYAKIIEDLNINNSIIDFNYGSEMGSGIYM